MPDSSPQSAGQDTEPNYAPLLANEITESFANLGLAIQPNDAQRLAQDVEDALRAFAEQLAKGMEQTITQPSEEENEQAIDAFGEDPAAGASDSAAGGGTPRDPYAKFDNAFDDAELAKEMQDPNNADAAKNAEKDASQTNTSTPEDAMNAEQTPSEESAQPPEENGMNESGTPSDKDNEEKDEDEDKNEDEDDEKEEEPPPEPPEDQPEAKPWQILKQRKLNAIDNKLAKATQEIQKMLETAIQKIRTSMAAIQREHKKLEMKKNWERAKLVAKIAWFFAKVAAGLLLILVGFILIILIITAVFGVPIMMAGGRMIAASFLSVGKAFVTYKQHVKNIEEEQEGMTKKIKAKKQEIRQEQRLANAKIKKLQEDAIKKKQEIVDRPSLL